MQPTICSYCRGTGRVTLANFTTSCGVCFGSGEIDDRDQAAIKLAIAFAKRN